MSSSQFSPQDFLLPRSSLLGTYLLFSLEFLKVAAFSYCSKHICRVYQADIYSRFYIYFNNFLLDVSLIVFEFFNLFIKMKLLFLILFSLSSISTPLPINTPSIPIFSALSSPNFNSSSFQDGISLQNIPLLSRSLLSQSSSLSYFHKLLCHLEISVKAIVLPADPRLTLCLSRGCIEFSGTQFLSIPQSGSILFLSSLAILITLER